MPAAILSWESVNLNVVGRRSFDSGVGKIPLEKAMAAHSSILAWRVPWTEEPGGLQSMGRKESDMTEQLHFSLSLLL